MEIVTASALISINATFFIQLISFLVFLFVLNRVMIRPLIATMQQRRSYLDTVAEQVQQAKTILVQLARDLDSQRSQAIHEAEEQIRQLDAEAEHRSVEAFEAARLQIAQMRQETDQRIKEQLKGVRAHLTDEVGALTTLIIDKVLHRRSLS